MSWGRSKGAEMYGPGGMLPVGEGVREFKVTKLGVPPAEGVNGRRPGRQGERRGVDLYMGDRSREAVFCWLTGGGIYYGCTPY